MIIMQYLYTRNHSAWTLHDLWVRYYTVDNKIYTSADNDAGQLNC